MSEHSSKLNIIGLLVCLLLALAGTAVSQEKPKPQTPPKPEKVLPAPRPRAERPPRGTPARAGEPTGTSEKALAVASNVTIRIPCISQARVTVNGWQRDEIRVFVRNGSPVSFKIHEKDPKSGKPIWVQITRQAESGRPTPFSECLSGERIDIEVPFGTSLSIVGRESQARIDSVKKVNIQNLDGNVRLRNVTGGITAETFRGDVAVESSAGQITLKTSTGNIVAFEVSPGQVGEVFRASTSSGTITMQKVEHRQITANSVSGTLLFNGVFLPGGIYNFKTSNGLMKLAVPSKSSGRIQAWYGFGSIESEIPWKIVTENISPGGKSMVAMMGEGDANINLTTNSGQISFIKQ